MAIVIDAAADVYERTTGTFPAGNAVTLAAFVYFNADRDTYSIPFQCNDRVGQPLGIDSVHMTTTVDGTSLIGEIAVNGSFVSTATILTLSAGNWYFMAVTHDGSTVRGYAGLLTAAALATQSQGHALGTPAALDQLLLGGEGQTGSEWMNCRLAGFKAWDAILSADELEMERRQILPVRFANLHEFHPLVDPNATGAAVDFSGNGRHLDNAGTATFGDGPPVPWRLARRRRTGVVAAAGDLEAVIGETRTFRSTF